MEFYEGQSKCFRNLVYLQDAITEGMLVIASERLFFNVPMLLDYEFSKKNCHRYDH